MVLFQVSVAAQSVTEDRVEFTVIEAPWMVSLDSRSLEIQDQQVKPDNQSGYFLLYDKKDSLTVSLFIEPVVKCKTSEECRDFVLKTGNPEWGKVQNVVNSGIGDFSCFEFFRPRVQNKPVQMLDMYAEHVADGFWVDLHISKISYNKTDHALFENLIKSIRFVSKTGEPVADSDKSIQLARKAVEPWMSIWDSGDYAGSYKALAPVSKKAFNEETWATVWNAERKPLGKLRRREIINISLVKSLGNLPGNSGVALKYQSSFEEHKDVFETFFLILENDGTWHVLGYEVNN